MEAGAKFCVKCFSRLDESSVRNVVDIYEISSRNKMLKEFSSDGYIYDHDLSGETVKGMRLIERIGSVAGESYYRSSDVSDGKNNVKTIHHVVLPLKESYDTLLFLNGFDKKKTAAMVQECVYRVDDEIKDFMRLSEAAGLKKIYNSANTLHSEQLGTFHVFIIMENVIPLWNYISTNEVTLRNVIEWGIELSQEMIQIENAGYEYAEVTDANIYFDSDGHVHLGARTSFRLAEIMYENSYSAIRNLYVCPEGWPVKRNVYSLAMVLYLLLNSMKHPFINYYDEGMNKNKYLTAEKLRAECAEAQLPRFARNSLGKTLIRAFSSVDDHVLRLNELNAILKNSLNYISTEELNTVVLNINK